MKLRMPTLRPARGRPPDDPSGIASKTASRSRGRRRSLRNPTVAGVAVAISLCALGGCALLVPGFVLGAESPHSASRGPGVVPRDLTPTEPSPTPTTPPPTTDEPSEAIAAGPSSGVPLVTLPWGAGEGQVGMLMPAEGLARGPEALAVTPNGRIAVLDSVNKRLLFLDATGRPSGTAEIALAEPRFLAVDNDRLYVLDCDADRKVLVLDWAGAVRETLPLPELPDVVTALFAAEVGPCVEVAHDSVFLLTKDAGAAGAAPNRSSLRSVAGRPLDRTLTRAAKVTFAPTKGLHMKTFKVERGSLKATKLAEASPGRPSTHKVEHLVSVDGDGAGGLIVGARVIDAVDSGLGQSMRNKPAELLLTRFDSKGQAHGAMDELLLAESNFVYLGQPYVIAPDGRVYQPVADESGYTILIHSFSDTKQEIAREEVLP